MKILAGVLMMIIAGAQGYQITVNGITEGEEIIHILAQSAAVVVFIFGMSMTIDAIKR